MAPAFSPLESDEAGGVVLEGMVEVVVLVTVLDVTSEKANGLDNVCIGSRLDVVMSLLASTLRVGWEWSVVVAMEVLLVFVLLLEDASLEDGFRGGEELFELTAHHD